MLTINNDHYTAQAIEEQSLIFDAVLSDMLSNRADKVIAACLDDTATWLALCFHARKNRLTVMPIHPSTPLEAAQQAALKAGCHILFYQDLDSPITIDSPHQAPLAPGLIQMSSGTTGEAKCINRSWEAIETEINSYIRTFTPPDNMTPVIACPVTHAYGLICGVMVALARGQTPIIVTNINPKYLIKTLRQQERPLLYASPPLLQGLISLWPKETPLHAAMTSGTLMSPSTFAALSPHITHLFQQYGCSEAGCISINARMTTPSDMGTALPHLKLLCSHDPDKPSEIIVEVKDSGQLIHTQDLGYLTPNDAGTPCLHFVARQDDTIIVAGLNVYPQDIEDIIRTHPAITDALVFKLEDAYAGHRVCLHYVADQPVDARALRLWCQKKMAAFQVPFYLHQVPEINRMANGKVNRKKAAKAHQQALQSSPTNATA